MEILLLICWRTFYLMKEIPQKWSRYSKLSGSLQSSSINIKCMVLVLYRKLLEATTGRIIELKVGTHIYTGT
jgi:hypothetical protein